MQIAQRLEVGVLALARVAGAAAGVLQASAVGPSSDAATSPGTDRVRAAVEDALRVWRTIHPARTRQVQQLFPMSSSQQ